MINILDLDPNLLDAHEIELRDVRLIIYDISYAKKQNTFSLVFSNLDAVFQKNDENYTKMFYEIAE